MELKQLLNIFSAQLNSIVQTDSDKMLLFVDVTEIDYQIKKVLVSELESVMSNYQWDNCMHGVNVPGFRLK